MQRAWERVSLRESAQEPCVSYLYADSIQQDLINIQVLVSRSGNDVETLHSQQTPADASLHLTLLSQNSHLKN